MNTEDLDFHLPPELIAQTPAPNRSSSRLLHYIRRSKNIAHHPFSELPKLLKSGDLMVFNDARVLPARFTLVKPTGGHVEGLFVSQMQDGHWIVMLKNLGPVRAEMTLHFLNDLNIGLQVLEKLPDGNYRVMVESSETAVSLLERIGRMPLPPYIKRQKDRDELDALDHQRYQTIFAKAAGSIAAPTAGLHFTNELLKQLDEKGIARTAVTLHVGLGTFKPISTDRLEEHAMHVESYSIGTNAAEDLNRAKREGRRIVAVGTTAARVLESQDADEPFVAKTSETSIFIYPPYHWKHVGALITNFHLPRSTLIALVAALTGLDEQRRIYKTAIEQTYRFFSYGDAMLVE